MFYARYEDIPPPIGANSVVGGSLPEAEKKTATLVPKKAQGMAFKPRTAFIKAAPKSVPKAASEQAASDPLAKKQKLSVPASAFSFAKTESVERHKTLTGIGGTIRYNSSKDLGSTREEGEGVREARLPRVDASGCPLVPDLFTEGRLPRRR